MNEREQRLALGCETPEVLECIPLKKDAGKDGKGGRKKESGEEKQEIDTGSTSHYARADTHTHRSIVFIVIITIMVVTLLIIV